VVVELQRRVHGGRRFGRVDKGDGGVAVANPAEVRETDCGELGLVVEELDELLVDASRDGVDDPVNIGAEIRGPDNDELLFDGAGKVVDGRRRADAKGAGRGQKGRYRKEDGEDGQGNAVCHEKETERTSGDDNEQILVTERSSLPHEALHGCKSHGCSRRMG